MKLRDPPLGTYPLQRPLIVIRNPSRLTGAKLNEGALFLHIRAENCLLMLWPEDRKSRCGRCQGGRQDGCVLHLAGVLVRLSPIYGTSDDNEQLWMQRKVCSRGISLQTKLHDQPPK